MSASSSSSIAAGLGRRARNVTKTTQTTQDELEAACRYAHAILRKRSPGKPRAVRYGEFMILPRGVILNVVDFSVHLLADGSEAD